MHIQRVAKSTRLGGPDRLQLDRFTEALYDEESGLTFPALTGQRKQSVRDAENLFSKGVEDFMKRKGYTYEEKFVRCIRNWRRACDERGLPSLQRSRFNYQLLNLMLDELMPWHREVYDFSQLEVNRYVWRDLYVVWMSYFVLFSGRSLFLVSLGRLFMPSQLALRVWNGSEEKVC